MNLRNTRLDRRLTQPQIVAKMKEVEPRVDVALYSKMESGICLPTPAQMGVILSVLDCHLHDLYTLDEIAFPLYSAGSNRDPGGNPRPGASPQV